MSKTHTDKRFQAKYHPIADKDGWPIANFIILMDRIHNGPTRAELHIDVEAPEHTEEQALRKAQEILAKQYATTVPGDGKLEVRLMRVEQVHDTMHLDIPVIEEAATQPLWSGSLLLAAAALLMIVIGLGWGLMTLIGRTSSSEAGTQLTVPIVAADGSQTGANQTGADLQVASANDGQSIISGGIDPNLPQTNGLPVSKNANNDLNIGQKVRVVPGSALTLRTQPGAADGDPVGYMQDAQQATIVGGPYWVQGNSDTIVWWFVRLDDGREAWAPANDSLFKLLEPVP